MSVIEVLGAGRTYGSGDAAVHAVAGATLAVERGEFVAIEGPSGSGKTTLLGLLAGLEAADAGTVRVLGHDLARLSSTERAQLRRTRIGIVFQAFGLVASLTAVENVALPLRLAGRGTTEAVKRAENALDAVDVGGLARHRIDELSGGERQRVGVARAIAIEPAVILADEPTGNLDERSGRLVIELLARQARASGTAVVLITHDAAAAAAAARRYAMADGRLTAVRS
jgi:putative ABC transport system ATP-binding protein